MVPDVVDAKKKKENPRAMVIRLIEANISEEEIAQKLVSWFHSENPELTKWVLEQFIGKAPQNLKSEHEEKKTWNVTLTRYGEGGIKLNPPGEDLPDNIIDADVNSP